MSKPRLLPSISLLIVENLQLQLMIHSQTGIEISLFKNHYSQVTILI